MPFRVFPTENNVGIGAGFDSQIVREALLVALIDARGKSPMSSYVVSGLTMTGGGPGQLAVDVAIGSAVINGFLVEVKTATERRSGLTANAANYIFLKYTLDGNGLVNGAALDSNTTAVYPANSVLLGQASTNAIEVTSIVNSVPVPNLVKGSYIGNGQTNRDIFLGFFPRRVTVTWTDSGARRAESGIDAGVSEIGIFTLGSGALALSLSTLQRPEIFSTFPGFRVSGSALNEINQSGITYKYLAEP